MIFRTKNVTIGIHDKIEAIYVIDHFCDYCNKDSIAKFHCSYTDSKECEEIKQKIVKEFSKEE